jgi:predicted transposase YdaD
MEAREQEVVMQIVTTWMEEGIEIGKQQGIEEGKQQGIGEGKLSLVMRLLPRRVGILTPELEARVKQLSVSQLEDLAVALLDFASVEDLTAWLQQVAISTDD